MVKETAFLILFLLLPLAQSEASSSSLGSMPAGFFQIPSATPIYYSNGLGHYCQFLNWATFLADGGDADLFNVTMVDAIAPTMIADGACSVPGGTIYSPQFWLSQGSADTAGNPSGYVYAPSIVRVDGTYHMYYCSKNPDPARGWDAIRHSTSVDGQTWTTPDMILQSSRLANAPNTDGTACDPSIVFYDIGDGAGPMYYLFYGGYPTGIGGAIYVARSNNLAGPFAKWTMRGTWETDPLDPAIVIRPAKSLTGVSEQQASATWYGAGEPTVIVHNGQLQVWYYDDTTDYPGQKVAMAFMATSSNGVNWTSTPTHLDDQMPIESVDVKFDPVSQQYVMVDTPNKMVPGAYLERRFSTDGITWSAGDLLCPSGTCFPSYGGNVGMSGDNQGQLLADQTIIGFGSPFLNTSNQCPADNTNCQLVIETRNGALNGITVSGYFGPQALTVAPQSIPVYRFYKGPFHLLTNFFLEGIDAGFTFEQEAFAVFTSGGVDLVSIYRCYVANGDHFISRDPQCEGQTTESSYGYVHASPGSGLQPVYRMYNPILGDHLETVNEVEGFLHGYVLESVLGYVPIL